MEIYLRITIVLRKLLNVKYIGAFLYLKFLAAFAIPALMVAQCPTVESFIVDACGKERQDEFVVIHSGEKGFNVGDLQLDFDSNNNNFGSLNNDIHIDNGNNSTDPTPCSLVPGNVSLLGGCSYLIAVGDGDFVPPNSILIVQIGNTASYTYDFTALCSLGVCIYVSKNSCDRTSGAFSNFGTGSRTLKMSLSDGSGCSETCTYDRSLLVGSEGAYFAPALAGNKQYGNNGCGVTPIVHEPLSPIAFAGKDTSICVRESMVVHLNGMISGSAISAMWNGGQGDFNDVQLLDAEYYPTDNEISTGKVSLFLTTNELGGSGTCQSTTSTIQILFDSLPVDIQPVNDYNGYGLACSGDSNGVIQAFVSGVLPYDYLWNIGDNKNINSNLASGEYRVTAVDALGCLGSSFIQLTEPENIQLQWEAFPEGCNGIQGHTVVDGMNGGVSPFELFLDGEFQGTFQNSAFFVKNLPSGQHQLGVVDANNCQELIDFDIEEGYIFDVDLGPDVIISQGEKIVVTLNTGNNTILESISWTIDSLIDCSFCESIELIPLFSERVKVEVVDNKGCVASDDMQIFVERPGPYVPNVFSPNGDGINDFLTIQGSSQMKMIDYFTLFDRFGSEIIHVEKREFWGLLDVWDGFYNGRLMISQVFFYKMGVTFMDNQVEEYYGNVTILR